MGIHAHKQKGNGYAVPELWSNRAQRRCYLQKMQRSAP